MNIIFDDKQELLILCRAKTHCFSSFTEFTIIVLQVFLTRQTDSIDYFALYIVDREDFLILTNIIPALNYVYNLS
jgi:hypothetical protein